LPRRQTQRRNPPQIKEIIMNVKSLLLAAVVASSVGSTAFANNYFDDGVQTQVAQVTSRSARVATDAGYMARSDIPTSVKAEPATRSRAEVRAETVQSLRNGEARAQRDFYVGGAQ
jgi:hypothetical protein